ncbi:hypothetical protein A3Q34_06065 [Colwellia sp. PAMC 20917]|nr:hypothetical protein A3Q34_06065 [Colwellia sp. PAMC 20917]
MTTKVPLQKVAVTVTLKQHTVILKEYTVILKQYTVIPTQHTVILNLFQDLVLKQQRPDTEINSA